MKEANSKKAESLMPTAPTLDAIRSKLVEMAEWKDGQFMGLINDKLDYARVKIDELHDKQKRMKYEGMRKVLLEIKKEIENGKGNG